jgi:hypothetical protein
LRVSPWPSLTADEQTQLRQHREAVKQLVRAGLPEVPIHAPTVEQSAPMSKVKAAPAPEMPEHIRRIIDGRTESETSRRRLENTAVMLAMLPYGHHNF